VHEDKELLTAGPPLEEATGAMIMLHGRGAAAADILSLSSQFEHEGLAFLAPNAEENSWFPYSFLVPLNQNEPGLQSALSVVHSLVMEASLSGIPRKRIFLFGFSQGACLALEYAARNPGVYGGVFALSGGLIGPPGTTWETEERFPGSPIFIGGSDVDPHIPQSRVKESAEVLKELGAKVFLKLYSGMGHTINGAELKMVNEIIRRRYAAGATAPKKAATA
jgi:phospholipase/carboxylesterase